MGNRTWLVTIILFFISLIIFNITSAGNTAYNHFVLLADAMNHGKIYIEVDMPWLEKIPINSTKFFVANPPMPAIISMIPVLFLGRELPQQVLSHIFGAISVAIVFLIAIKIKNNLKLAIWAAILFGFGTLNWYLISVGSTWYMAQIVGQMFLLLAIFVKLKKISPMVSGLFLGFAYFCRIPIIFTFPFFIFDLPKPWFKNLILFSLGVLPSIILNSIYNYLRFGVIWDIGYTLIPGVSTEPWYQKGVIHPSYIIEHLKIIFLGLPRINDILSFKPSVFGYAIWFTTPAFIFSIFNNIKEKFVWSSWLSILLISLLIFSHGSTGFSQFGYRFAADFYPILLYLTITGVNRFNGPKLIHWVFLSISVLVNFWGVYSLNIFG
ncbi:MAG: hypothetical protein AAB778_01900 [Patescibacteria group bacterium]